jgi:hypothetical protein
MTVAAARWSHFTRPGSISIEPRQLRNMYGSQRNTVSRSIPSQAFFLRDDLAVEREPPREIAQVMRHPTPTLVLDEPPGARSFLQLGGQQARAPHSSFRRKPESSFKPHAPAWIPAFAGMTDPLI